MCRYRQRPPSVRAATHHTRRHARASMSSGKDARQKCHNPPKVRHLVKLTREQSCAHLGLGHIVLLCHCDLKKFHCRPKKSVFQRPDELILRGRSQSWIMRAHRVAHRVCNRLCNTLNHSLLQHEHGYAEGTFIKAMQVLSWVLILVLFPFSLFFCLQVTREYERVVMFRLGRLVGGSRGPGIFFYLPCVENFRKVLCFASAKPQLDTQVDLRTVSFDVPPQEILSKDSVTVTVDAVVYFRISNPVISVTNVSDATYSTKLLAQTVLRTVLGTKTLSEMLSERETIANVC